MRQAGTGKVTASASPSITKLGTTPGVTEPSTAVDVVPNPGSGVEAPPPDGLTDHVPRLKVASISPPAGSNVPETAKRTVVPLDRITGATFGLIVSVPMPAPDSETCEPLLVIVTGSRTKPLATGNGMSIVCGPWSSMNGVVAPDAVPSVATSGGPPGTNSADTSPGAKFPEIQ